MRLLIIISGLALSGCQVTPKPSYVWVNSNVPAAQLSGQWQIDKTECDVAAYNGVALPNVDRTAARDSGAASYEIAGQVEGNDAYGNYRSSYTATLTEKTGSGNPFLEGVRQGQEDARRDKQWDQFEGAVELRKDYRDTCLVQRGWQQTLKPVLN